MEKGLGYIRINGLIFEHADNGFPRSGTGTVTTWGGHHWIIEENTVRHINSVGIEIGAFTDERVDSGVYQHDCDLVVIAHNQVVDCDYFGRAHPADQVPVGPFIEGWSKVRRQLQLVPNS